MRVDRPLDHRHCTGRHRYPATAPGWNWLAAIPGDLARRFAAGMCDLDARHGAAFDDDRRQPGQQGLMFRGVRAQAAWRDAADGGDMGRLGDDDPGTTGRLGAEILDVPVVAETIGGAVLAHRRYH